MVVLLTPIVLMVVGIPGTYYPKCWFDGDLPWYKVNKITKTTNPSETLGFSCRMLVGNTSSLIHLWSIFPGSYVNIVLQIV